MHNKHVSYTKLHIRNKYLIGERKYGGWPSNSCAKVKHKKVVRQLKRVHFYTYIKMEKKPGSKMSAHEQ